MNKQNKNKTKEMAVIQYMESSLWIPGVNIVSTDGLIMLIVACQWGLSSLGLILNIIFSKTLISTISSQLQLKYNLHGLLIDFISGRSNGFLPIKQKATTWTLQSKNVKSKHGFMFPKNNSAY